MPLTTIQPSGRTFYGALLNRATQGSNIFTNGAGVACPWDVVNYDTGYNGTLFFNSGTSTTKFVIPTGVTRVRLYAQACMAASSSFGAYSQILRNANGSSMPAVLSGTTNGSSFNCLATPPITVIAGDYFELYVLQNSGGATSFNAAFAQSFFAIEVVQ